MVRILPARVSVLSHASQQHLWRHVGRLVSQRLGKAVQIEALGGGKVGDLDRQLPIISLDQHTVCVERTMQDPLHASASLIVQQ